MQASFFLKMAITKSKKTEILTELEVEFKNSKSVAFTTFAGITVTEIQELRNQLRKSDARMIIAKKTLIRLAAKNSGLKKIPDESMEGPVAIVFSHESELAGFQTLWESKKKFEQIDILGGVFEGEILDKAKANQLAALPSKTALFGQIVGLLTSPIRGFVGVGNQVISGFVRTLDGVQKQKA